MEKLKEKITIGRSAGNRVQITNMTVSGRHCTIERISEDEFEIVDCDSSNGVMVNGRRVRKKTVSGKDKIYLGKFLLKLERIYPSLRPAKKHKALDYTEEFKRLKAVWEKYQQSKNDVKDKVNGRKTWIRALCALIPFAGNAIGIALTGRISDRKELQALENKFKSDYICPNPQCARYLGDSPYEALEKQKKCKGCRALWVSDEA